MLLSAQKPDKATALTAIIAKLFSGIVARALLGLSGLAAAYGLLSLVLVLTVPEQTETTPLEMADNTAAIDRTAADAVATAPDLTWAPLFGQVPAAPEPVKVAEPDPTPRVDTPPADDVKEFDPDDITLRGIIAGKTEISRALIEVDGKTGLFKVGDAVPDIGRIVAISPQAVEISVSGKGYVLKFKSDADDPEND